jgi:ribosomal protein L40E
MIAAALVVVIVVSLLMVVLGRQKKSETKQATLAQPRTSCVKCGADLSPKSKFCKECGTKQP